VIGIVLFAGVALYLLGLGFAFTLARAGARADDTLAAIREGETGPAPEWEAWQEDVGS
jgi:hypothetical protein